MAIIKKIIIEDNTHLSGLCMFWKVLQHLVSGVSPSFLKQLFPPVTGNRQGPVVATHFRIGA